LKKTDLLLLNLLPEFNAALHSQDESVGQPVLLQAKVDRQTEVASQQGPAQKSWK
jgi:hypothetical protein